MAVLAWLLVIGCALLYGVLVVFNYFNMQDSADLRAGRELQRPSIGEFLRASRERLLVWAVGLIAALAPNLMSLLEPPEREGMVTAAVLNTAASIALVGALSMWTARRVLAEHARHSQDIIVKILSLIFLTVSLVSAIYYLWAANYRLRGMYVGEWWWALLGTGLACNLMAEFWVANAAVEDERRSRQQNVKSIPGNDDTGGLGGSNPSGRDNP